MWYDGTNIVSCRFKTNRKHHLYLYGNIFYKDRLKRDRESVENKKNKKTYIHKHGGKEKKKHVHEEQEQAQAKEQVRNCYFVRYNGKIPV